MYWKGDNFLLGKCTGKKTFILDKGIHLNVNFCLHVLYPLPKRTDKPEYVQS